MEIESNLAGTFADSVRHIRRRFIDRLEQQIEELDDCASEIEQGQQAAGALIASSEIVHRLSGVARTLGFPQLGHLAGEAENALIAATKKPSNGNHNQALDAIERLVTEMIRIGKDDLCQHASDGHEIQ